MRQSQIFSKTRFEAPKDEISKNAEILIRAGFIHKEMAGIYSILPLGVLVIKKIAGIIKEEMTSLGAVEISMSSLQNKEVWEKSGRWSDETVDNWFKSKIKNGGDVGFAFTHEEPITAMLKDHVRSYKDLPIFVYQFQRKFRNETRAKSGILRTREFLMKDLYSFSRTKKEHDKFYEKAKEAYKRIFDLMGIGKQTHLTFASGGVFSEFSHEFQTETPSGEDVIFVDTKKELAVNKEVFNEKVLKNLSLEKKKMTERKTVEVGNIFSLGTKYSEALGLSFTDEKGELHYPYMGSYGIGVERLFGTIAEIYGDEDSMIWPDSVSPFKVHLIDISNGDEGVRERSDELYKTLQAEGLSVLYDDREMRAGEKFADADLIGIPLRIVSGKKSMQAKSFEFTDRRKNKTTNLDSEKIIKLLS